jgi:hypothetical protein
MYKQHNTNSTHVGFLQWHVLSQACRSAHAPCNHTRCLPAATHVPFFQMYTP